MSGMVRHFWILVFLGVFLAVSGCGEKLVCSAPNVVIGNSCCLDSDSDFVCDTQQKNIVEKEDDISDMGDSSVSEPVVEMEELSESAVFAQKFADTWNKKSYNALRNLFVDDYSLRYSPQEFNFLARKIDAKSGLFSVSFDKVSGSSANYILIVDGNREYVSADIVDDGGTYKHKAFFFFDGLDAQAACKNNDSCFFDYALISKNKNYCEYAGDMRIECIDRFGVSKSITEKIDGCVEIRDTYSRADCLTDVAVKENNIEPCWSSEFDRQIFDCMGRVAAARKTVDDCFAFVSSRGYPGTKLQVAYCILGYVKDTSDTKACAKIDRRDDVVLGAMQEGCYRLKFP